MEVLHYVIFFYNVLCFYDPAISPHLSIIVERGSWAHSQIYFIQMQKVEDTKIICLSQLYHFAKGYKKTMEN